MKNRLVEAGVVLSTAILPGAANVEVVTGAIAGAIIAGPVGAVVGATISAANILVDAARALSRSRVTE
jgi:hypothetical protein